MLLKCCRSLVQFLSFEKNKYTRGKVGKIGGGEEEDTYSGRKGGLDRAGRGKSRTGMKRIAVVVR